MNEKTSQIWKEKQIVWTEHGDRKKLLELKIRYMYEFSSWMHIKVFIWCNCARNGKRLIRFLYIIFLYSLSHTLPNLKCVFSLDILRIWLQFGIGILGKYTWNQCVYFICENELSTFSVLFVAYMMAFLFIFTIVNSPINVYILRKKFMNQ